jgi:hypothetical protein
LSRQALSGVSPARQGRARQGRWYRLAVCGMRFRALFVLVPLLAAMWVPYAPAATPSSRTLDLATGRLDGHPVLGLTLPQVTASLGRPDFRIAGSSYRIGWGTRPNFSAEVLFQRRHGVLRAWSMAFERGPVRDPKIGQLLALNSRSLQAAILDSYGNSFRLIRAYACSPGTCVGELAPRTGSSLHLTFGTRRALGTWVTAWKPLPGA